MSRSRFLSAFLIALLVAPAALAASKVRLGVFLPTTVLDGNERFALSEKLGASLSESLGRPVTVKNFGRAQDLATAMKGQLDLVIVEGWAAAQLSGKTDVLGMAAAHGEAAPRWAIVSPLKGAVKDLKSKRLAMCRGFDALDAKFASNVIFGGDINVKDHFKLIGVPNAESLKPLLDSKSAEAALIPLSHVEKGWNVMFRSDRLPGVVAIQLTGDREATRSALFAMEAVAPLGPFKDVDAKSIARLRALVVNGPPPRLPTLAEAPVLRPDPSALLDTEQLGLVLPAFTEFMESSNEKPDD